MTQEEKAKAYDEALKRAKAAIDVAADKDLVGGVVRTIFPELAESEDERIRRWLCDYFSSIDKAWIHKDITCIDILRWLEKQKEQKKEKFPPYVTGFKGHPDPAGTSDLEEAADEYADKHGFRVPYDGSNNYYDDVDVKASKEGFLAGAEWQKEQKPAEWSEEDEKDMAHIIRILDDCYVYGTHDLSKTDRENLVNKLKSLRPQYHGDVTMTEAYKMGLEAGKASSWKPSEQEKGALRTAIHVLTEERSFPKAAEHLQAILDAFEDKESRKDWKPSEEQMEALHRCVDYLEESDNEDAEFMESLLEQLKKLM